MPLDEPAGRTYGIFFHVSGWSSKMPSSASEIQLCSVTSSATLRGKARAMRTYPFSRKCSHSSRDSSWQRPITASVTATLMVRNDATNVANAGSVAPADRSCSVSPISRQSPLARHS